MELELQHEFLADENERSEAKTHFLDIFGNGKTKSLSITVGPYKDTGFEKKLGEYLNYKLGITSSSVSEKGFFSKKRTSVFITKPIRVSEESMSNLSNAFYDVILAFGVKVDVAEV